MHFSSLFYSVFKLINGRWWTLTRGIFLPHKSMSCWCTEVNLQQCSKSELFLKYMIFHICEKWRLKPSDLFVNFENISCHEGCSQFLLIFASIRFLFAAGMATPPSTPSAGGWVRREKYLKVPNVPGDVVDEWEWALQQNFLKLKVRKK